MAHTIMVVEDERVSLALVKFGLTEQRYNVIEAADGEQALEKLKTENPDLIILDIMMPKMSGYEFLTELKSKQGFETTPVIILTGNENLEDVFRIEGVKDYMVKPVELPTLLKKIREILGENPLDD